MSGHCKVVHPPSSTRPNERQSMNELDDLADATLELGEALKRALGDTLAMHRDLSTKWAALSVRVRQLQERMERVA